MKDVVFVEHTSNEESMSFAREKIENKCFFGMKDVEFFGRTCNEKGMLFSSRKD